MRKSFPVDELARDRALRPRRRCASASTTRVARPTERRAASGTTTGSRPTRPDAPDAARALMHGIFVGEIQALEGAGRTCWDFDDRRRRRRGAVRAEARHGPPVLGRGPPRARSPCKLTDWMGTEIGEFSETTFLYEAACNPDPVLRLTGVNRALEGLAIDVFNTMKEFGDIAGDPVLEFCEDWMLADEVTHVKMGSDWLRRLTDERPRAAQGARSSSSASSTSSSRSAASAASTKSQPDQARPPLPRAGRLRHRRDRRDRASSPRRRCTRPTTKRREARERAQAAVATS